MNDLSRYEVNSAYAGDRLEAKLRLFRKVQNAARQDTTQLNLLLTTAREILGYMAIVGLDPAPAATSVRAGVEAAVAMFCLASASPGSLVEVQLGEGPPVKLEATGPNDAADASNWCYGFYLAALLRSERALDYLCGVSSRILRASSTRSDECVYLYIEALQSLWQHKADAATRLKLALEATAPERLQVGAAYVLNILVPELELVYYFALREPQRFNETLSRALKHHNKYWGQKKLRLEPAGFLALGPLAFAALAHDAGMPITIESDLLPSVLFQGTVLQP